MSDALMAGFPPPRESVVSLGNWQEPPFNRWSFQHLREIVPTQRIARGARAKALVRADNPPALDHIAVTRIGAGPSTVGEVLADTWTDAVIVLHDGQIVLERYFGQMRANTPHLLMSVSKSIVGCVCGILASQAPPGPRGADHAVRSGDRRLRLRRGHRATPPRHAHRRRVQRGLRGPRRRGARHRAPHGLASRAEDESGGLYAYLASLSSQGPHGGPFVYRSADTDVLGWVCERAAGVRMADLVSTLIWAPMGAEYDAEITCDGLGSAVHDGGVSATARDMARFGNMLLHDGWVGHRPVVPESWLQQARHIDADIRSAFAASDSEPVLPGGWYRNQFWFVPGPSGDILLCLGINGQMVFVDRATRTVAVKLSSWPTAQDPAHLVDTIRAFAAVGRHLAGFGPVGDAAAARPSGPSGIVEGQERGHG